ncbi:hypothetical protein J6590_064609 [Homalodisca vitripennis]|nr:hypothetical protein J6590_064609 [Homalodisca vitripennis]
MIRALTFERRACVCGAFWHVAGRLDRHMTGICGECDPARESDSQPSGVYREAYYKFQLFHKTPQTTLVQSAKVGGCQGAHTLEFPPAHCIIYRADFPYKMQLYEDASSDVYVP